MKTSKQQEREQRIAERMTHCKHFNGIGIDDAKKCKASVCYREHVGGEMLGWACRIPCITTGASKNVVACDKREPYTFDEAAHIEDELEARSARFVKAFDAVHSDAKSKGLKKGSGGVSECSCPNCDGVIRYSVARVNGHVLACCSTAGCISWME